jgi:SAM-dependent methyltransferase
MDPKEYEIMFAVEDRHWWYLGMERIAITLVSHFYPYRRDLQILDAGCGTGAAMGYLAPFGTVTGCDLSQLALGYCQKRGLSHLGQATIVSLPFADERFDLVTSFDVLYHRAVGDYGQALKEFHRVLKPSGRHDEAIHTAHRFTSAELRQAFTSANLSIEKLSYANTLLFPLALGKRMAERVVPGRTASDIHPNPPWQDRLLVRFLYLEARWLTHHTLPFGLTVVGLGRKG